MQEIARGGADRSEADRHVSGKGLAYPKKEGSCARRDSYGHGTRWERRRPAGGLPGYFAGGTPALPVKDILDPMKFLKGLLYILILLGALAAFGWYFVSQ